MQAYNTAKWKTAVEVGQVLLREGLEEERLAESLGKAYFNLGDFYCAKRYLQKIPESNLAKTAEKFWFLGTVDNHLKNYMSACENFSEARKALTELESISPEEVAREKGELWAQKGFKADLLVQHAVNEMICGDIENAVRDYRAAVESAITSRDKCEFYSAYLLTMHNRLRFVDKLLKETKRYNDLFLGIPKYEHDNCREHGKIRIGYVSADFRRHVMFYFYYGLFLARTKVDFEVHAYYLGKREDRFTALVRGNTDYWHSLADDDYDEAARKIHADEIDILVDLGGHSVNSGLPILARRPAPVQISGIGYMGSTGLQTVDYLITDTICDPEDSEQRITEKPLYLPSLFCYIGRSDVPVSKGTPSKKRGYITFGVFNRYNKITDEMLRLWQSIQIAVPNACFYFKADAFADKLLLEKAYARLKLTGFNMERVLFESASDDYMERYLDVDIALDTFPYTGGGTTCDALYMGVPVITMAGSYRGTSFSASILGAVGMEELVARDEREYRALAVTLAKDMETLDDLHVGLRDMMRQSLLMDVERYVRALEGQYRRIWDEFRKSRKNGKNVV